MLDLLNREIFSQYFSIMTKLQLKRSKRSVLLSEKGKDSQNDSLTTERQHSIASSSPIKVLLSEYCS